MKRIRVKLGRIEYIGKKEVDQVMGIMFKTKSTKEDVENFFREKGRLKDNEKIIDVILTGGMEGRVFIGE
jgi:hypothetical protein